MKQMLKETIKLWISLILILASIVVIIGVPSLILTYAGMGEWQVIVSTLWLLFCLSLTITVGLKANDVALENLRNKIEESNKK